MRRAEQRKFGVFFDDDYDYMQHLRDVNEINEVEPMQYVPVVMQDDTAGTEGGAEVSIICFLI